MSGELTTATAEAKQQLTKSLVEILTLTLKAFKEWCFGGSSGSVLRLEDQPTVDSSSHSSSSRKSRSGGGVRHGNVVDPDELLKRLESLRLGASSGLSKKSDLSSESTFPKDPGKNNSAFCNFSTTLDSGSTACPSDSTDTRVTRRRKSVKKG